MIQFSFKRDRKDKLKVEAEVVGSINVEIDEDKLIREAKEKVLKSEIRKAVKEFLPSPYPHTTYIGYSSMLRDTEVSIAWIDAQELLTNKLLDQYKESL